MLKKFLASSIILLAASSPIAGLISQSTSVSADTTSPKLSEKSNTRMVGGSWRALFTAPWQTKSVDAGTYDISCQHGILLEVTNGGPEDLSWAAHIVNGRTGRTITDGWINFEHGTDYLYLPIPAGSDVKNGDELYLEFTNNNLPYMVDIYGVMAGY